MEIHVDTLVRVTKAFIIDRNGTIRILNVPAINVRVNRIDLQLGMPNDSTLFSGSLISTDGFNYSGSYGTAVPVLSISCRCFRKDQGILLYGNWSKGHEQGELCIHGVLSTRTTNFGQSPNFGYLPPAA